MKIRNLMLEWEASSSSLLAVTLKHSGINRPQAQRLVLRGLGLRRLQQTIIRPNTPQVRGLIRKVMHLVEVKAV